MIKKIDLTITHDYLNPFASPDNPKLSPELVDYLSDSAWYHPELCLDIRCPEDERERLQQAISNTVAQKSENRLFQLMTHCNLRDRQQPAKSSRSREAAIDPQQ
ncbi:hypothetical protein [Pseudomonas mandelii]|uniref:hypothetical protein n=1 Tax=Pseudomonas mandelii TaxID=75612 RepID=UPI00224B387D|nr:hypothetical protein [Pseudomonas mandelii]MCX2901519.1 hypothetical protein [Pseudomonas mandelii]